MPENNAQTPLAVVAHGIEKSFVEGSLRTEVLKGIDLECEAGQLLMIVGPSGCGKTTLLSCIAGTLSVNRGEIRVFDQPITHLDEEAKIEFRRRYIGFIFQQFNLIPTLTLRENVSIPLLINGVEEESALQSAEAMLKQVGLTEKTEMRPAKLSGGQQQRVAIARALVHKPKLVICDEPTSSLDGKTGHAVVELLKDVARSGHRTVILVTHDSRIFHFADRIVEMEDGRIKQIHLDSTQLI